MKQRLEELLKIAQKDLDISTNIQDVQYHSGRVDILIELLNELEGGKFSYHMEDKNA